MNYSWLLNFTTEFSNELLESESDIHNELSHYNERLQEILEIHLKRILANTETKTETGIGSNELKLIIKLCKELKKMNLFEATFKLSIVYPILESTVSISSGSDSVFSFKSFIKSLLNNFLKPLNSSWKEILKEFYDKEEYKFWIRTVLSPILLWMTERCSNIFNPIDLDEFKENFTEGLNFISDIEKEFLVFEDEVIFFRSQSSWINFMKKWSLHQYYQLRIKQFIAPIENSETKELQNNLFVTNALNQIWSDEIILKPLIPKFLKITLQTIRRFINFCTEDASIYRNPKVFLLNFLQKQSNLKEFKRSIEKDLFPLIKKHLKSLEEEDDEVDLLLNNIKKEVEASIRQSSNNLLSEIEKIYDKQKEDVKLLSLDALILFKQYKDKEIENDKEKDMEKEDMEIIINNSDTDILTTSNTPFSINKQLVQQILLKFNRIIFKLIDEKRLKVSQYPEIIKKMKELEIEANQLGYFELENEEFWLEIKAEINKSG